jgi:hypothetical protein
MGPDTRGVEVLEDSMVAVYRGKTSLERLRIAFGLWTSTRNLLTGILRSEHPDWDSERVQAEVARRMSHGTA